MVTRTISSFMVTIMWLRNPLVIMPASLSNWWTAPGRRLFLLWRRRCSVRIRRGRSTYRWGSCSFVRGGRSPFVTWRRGTSLNRRTRLRWRGMMPRRHRRMMLCWWWSRPADTKPYTHLGATHILSTITRYLDNSLLLKLHYRSIPKVQQMLRSQAGSYPYAQFSLLRHWLSWISEQYVWLWVV